jgi:hypothetical protein
MKSSKKITKILKIKKNMERRIALKENKIFGNK